jgi:hypothetical protein
MYDLKDERGVPISAGIPPIVVIAAIIGLIMIFTVGTLVFSNSRYGHAWPASTATSIPLTS